MKLHEVNCSYTQHRWLHHLFCLTTPDFNRESGWLSHLEKSEQGEEGEDVPPRGVDLGPRGVLARHGAVPAGVAQERRV